MVQREEKRDRWRDPRKKGKSGYNSIKIHNSLPKPKALRTKTDVTFTQTLILCTVQLFLHEYMFICLILERLCSELCVCCFFLVVGDTFYCTNKTQLHLNGHCIHYISFLTHITTTVLDTQFTLLKGSC